MDDHTSNAVPSNAVPSNAVPSNAVPSNDLPLNGLAPDGWKPPSVESLAAWRVVRGVRSRRHLNQRELAVAAGVQRTTVERIEAQQVQPRYDTMLKLLSACGYAIVVADAGRQYDPVCEDPLGDRQCDQAGRLLPAHLPSWLITSEFVDPWWGWGRLAWHAKDPRVPPHTFRGRVRVDYDAYRRWQDAT
jgi:DNA-binding XRE family transcriptional regulator